MTTTTQPPTTTTTVPAAELIAAFVPEFTGWIADGDVGTLMATLHPDVVDAFGEDLCRSFVEREILALSDYRLTGPVTPDDGRYTGPVAFTFQGEEFEGTAGWGIVDGEVRWLTTCR